MRSQRTLTEPSATAAKVDALRRQGMSPGEIGERFGISRRKVFALLHEAKANQKPAAEQPS